MQSFHILLFTLIQLSHYLAVAQLAKEQFPQVTKMSCSASSVQAALDDINDRFKDKVQILTEDYEKSLTGLKGKTTDQLNTSMLYLIQNTNNRYAQLQNQYNQDYQNIAKTCRLNSIVQKQDHCLCEIGAEPRGQQFSFRAGCAIWLMQQRNCKAKQTVAPDFDFITYIQQTRAKSLSVGYVGHWSNTQQLVNYIQKRFETPIRDGVSIRIDNTGCSAMNSPITLEYYLKSIHKPTTSLLTIRGNQGLSVGKWDVFFFLRRANLWAQTTSHNGQVITTYPQCSSFEEHGCLYEAQGGTTGQCLQANGSLKTLTCCRISQQSAARGVYSNDVPETKSAWSATSCQSK